MGTRKHHIAVTLTTAMLSALTTAVLRRMEQEYATTDTLSRPAVVSMYVTYAAHTTALAWAVRRRVWAVPLPARSSR